MSRQGIFSSFGLGGITVIETGLDSETEQEDRLEQDGQQVQEVRQGQALHWTLCTGNYALDTMHWTLCTGHYALDTIHCCVSVHETPQVTTGEEPPPTPLPSSTGSTPDMLHENVFVGSSYFSEMSILRNCHPFLLGIR
jgi:hypothetical protein